MFVENISDTAGAIQEFISVLTIFLLNDLEGEHMDSL